MVKMIKNCTYTPVTATTRNELIDCITEKKEVIYIEDDAYQEIIKELKGYSKNKKFRKVGSGYFALGGISTLYSVIAGITSLTIPGIVFNSIASSVAFIIARVLSLPPEILRGYKLGHDIYENKSRFVLVSNKYSFEFDSTDDGYILTNNEKCPKCGNIYDANTKRCLVCNSHVINISTKKALDIIKY